MAGEDGGGSKKNQYKDWAIHLTEGHHMAYFRVHSRASSLYRSRSVLYILAISGTNGSSGFGSHNKEQIDSSTKSLGKTKKKDINKQLDKESILLKLDSDLKLILF